jgi:DNA repair protein RadC
VHHNFFLTFKIFVIERTTIASARYQVAEIELIYKSKEKASQRPQIRTSKDCYEVLKQSWDETKIDFA